MRNLRSINQVLILVAISGVGLVTTGSLLLSMLNEPAIARQSAVQQSAANSSATEEVKGKESMTWSEDSPFAVVELFTSEGCSSCPSADKNLSNIVTEAKKDKTQVFGLSYHVDYWNQLGWDDPYSLESATERQQIYARALGQNQVYTPQMIVNGTKQFVGSDVKQSRAVIAGSLETKPQTRIGVRLTPSATGIKVVAKTENTQPDDLILVALVQDHGVQQVARGENAGAKLSHSNIVRDFRVAELSNKDPEFALSRPEDVKLDQLRVIAFLQTRATAEITSVVATELK
jgi:hypothetical protein